MHDSELTQPLLAVESGKLDVPPCLLQNTVASSGIFAFPPLPPFPVLPLRTMAPRASEPPNSMHYSVPKNKRWDKSMALPHTPLSSVTVAPKKASVLSSVAFSRKPKALYMFAGAKRHSDVAHFLVLLGWELIELDIVLSKSHDLSRQKVQMAWRKRLQANEFQALLVSPPCDTFTRVQFSNTLGPAPLRCFGEPRGFPWLHGPRWTKVNLGNILSDFALDMVLIQVSLQPGLLFMEFPEDLGTIRNGLNRGLRPASIWQWPILDQIRQVDGVNEAGILQSDFEAPYLKPTRLLFKGVLAAGVHYPGPPVFDSLGFYLGPIPQINAASLGLRTLARQSSDTAFRTTGTAAWPPMLCKFAANSLNASWLAFVAKAPIGQTWAEPTLAASDSVGGEAPSAANNVPFMTFLPAPGFWEGGLGPPRSTYVLGKYKQFHDGAGLTSAGRWESKDRLYPPGRRWDLLRDNLYQLLIQHKGADGKCWGPEGLQKALLHFCVTPKTDVFPQELLLQGRDLLKTWISAQCSDFDSSERDVAEGQPFTLGIIFHMLREMKDPDYEIFNKFKTGVSAGIASPLPRNPVLYEEQVAWRLPELASEISEAENYGSLEEHKALVATLFEEEKAEGMMDCAVPSIFFERFKGRHAISSMAAILEKGGTKLRVLHDGTHTVHINNRIRCRDKLRSPGVAEKHTQFRARRKNRQIVLSLLLDVSKAHRRIKIEEAEQGFLGCKLSDDLIWWNRVGTFGTSSAAYWWSRMMGGLVRLLHGLLGARWPLEILAYADDVEATAGCALEREGITIMIFVLQVLGVPMKLSKYRGGFQVEWIGLEIDNRLYAIGLSLSRSDWVIKWISEVVTSKSVETINFAGGLGRLNFASTALLYERPWLGPLYSWSSTVQLSGLRIATAPWGVKFILYWLAKRLADGARLMITPSLPVEGGFLFKSDAKAEQGRATIGGWECRNDCPASCARWFFVELFQETTPWAFAKSNDPGRVVATLELLGTLLCLAIFQPSGDSEFRGVHTISGTTDNQGNSLALQKCMSTKWPLAPMLIELTEQLRHRKLELHLVWERRDKNKEADSITNECFDDFDASKRITVDFPAFPWLVLNDAMKWAKEVYDLAQDKKTNRPQGPWVSAPSWKRRKTAAAERLRCKDPW